MTMSPDQRTGTALLIGASRGLGLAMVAELVKKGWRVVGTVRECARWRRLRIWCAPPG